MTTYRLISFKLCPFVQRAVLVLEEKNIPYEIEFIDLNNKPDWFMQMSPTGKVPVLLVDGEHKIFESAVIAEFIDETSSPRLLPDDPLQRARQRMWIEFGSGLNMDVFGLTRATDEAEARGHADTLRGRLARLDAEITGPLFAGETFGLVDASIAPSLQRIGWLQDMVPSLDLWRGVDRVVAWRDALSQRDSIKNYGGGELETMFKARMKSLAGTWLSTAA